MNWGRIAGFLRLQRGLEIAEHSVREAQQKLNAYRLQVLGDRRICSQTMEPHLLVAFHSAAPEERLVCHDCGEKFRLDDNIVSGPHGRSKL